jgi:hypothetical protein
MIGNAHSEIKFPLLFLGGIAMLSFAFSGPWRGMFTTAGGGYQCPFYALYPASFWELAKLILKINLIRFLACLPFVLMVAGFTLHGLENQGVSLLPTFLKIVLGGLVIQPYMVIFAFSTGTNDTQRKWFCFAIVALLFLLVPILIFIVAMGSARWVLIAGAVTILISFGMLVLYGRFFNRGALDLLAVRTRQ